MMKTRFLIMIFLLCGLTSYSQKLSGKYYSVAMMPDNESILTIELNDTEPVVRNRNIWNSRVINEFKLKHKLEFNNIDNTMVVDPTMQYCAIAIPDVNHDTKEIAIYKLDKGKPHKTIDVSDIVGDVYLSQVLFMKFNQYGDELFFATRDRSFRYLIKKNKTEEILPNEDLALIDYDYNTGDLYYMHIRKLQGGGAELVPQKGYLLYDGESRSYVDYVRYGDYTTRYTKVMLTKQHPSINIDANNGGYFIISKNFEWIINKSANNVYIYNLKQK